METQASATELNSTQLESDLRAAQQVVVEAKQALDHTLAYAGALTDTAQAEARLNVAQLSALLTYSIVSAFVAMSAVVLVLALGGWWAVQAGAPVTVVIASALAINLGALWGVSRKINYICATFGFPVTLELLRRHKYNVQ